MLADRRGDRAKTAFASLRISQEQTQVLFANARECQKRRERKDWQRLEWLRVSNAVYEAGLEGGALEKRRQKALEAAGLDDASVQAQIEEIKRRVHQELVAEDATDPHD